MILFTLFLILALWLAWKITWATLEVFLIEPIVSATRLYRSEGSLWDIFNLIFLLLPLFVVGLCAWITVTIGW